MLKTTITTAAALVGNRKKTCVQCITSHHIKIYIAWLNKQHIQWPKEIDGETEMQQKNCSQLPWLQCATCNCMHCINWFFYSIGWIEREVNARKVKVFLVFFLFSLFWNRITRKLHISNTIAFYYYDDRYVNSLFFVFLKREICLFFFQENSVNSSDSWRPEEFSGSTIQTRFVLFWMGSTKEMKPCEWWKQMEYCLL